MSDRSQFILFDSKPRGLEISYTRDHQDVVGQTPVILRLPSRRSFQTYLLIDGERSRKVETTCRFSWGDLLLGNLPLAASLGPAWGGVYYGVAVATDLLSESAYSCPARVGFDVSDKVERSQPRVDKKQCRIIVAAPPYHFKAAVSEKLHAQWARYIQPQLGPCDSILEFERVRSQLARLDITFDKPSVLRNLTRMDMNRLGLETGATHFADLQVNEKNGRFEIETKLYDIRSSDSQILKAISVPALENSLFYTKVPQLFDQSFYFVPNAAALSSLFAFPEFRQDDKSYKFFRDAEEKDLWSIVSNWEISFVPRPSAHPNGTFRFQSSLALWTQLMQRKMNMYWRYSNADPEDGLYSINEKMNVFFIGATQEFREYLMFADYGAAFVGGGIGFSGTSGKLAGESSSRVGLYSQVYGGYLVETGPAVFLEMQGGYSVAPEPYFSTRFTDLSALVFIRVKAGFYLFGLRENIRSWL